MEESANKDILSLLFLMCDLSSFIQIGFLQS